MKFDIKLMAYNIVLTRLFIFVCLCENNMRDYDTLQMLFLFFFDKTLQMLCIIAANLHEEYILSCYISKFLRMF